MMICTVCAFEFCTFQSIAKAGATILNSFLGINVCVKTSALQMCLYLDSVVTVLIQYKDAYSILETNMVLRCFFLDSV